MGLLNSMSKFKVICLFFQSFRCVFKSRNTATDEIVAIKKMTILRTRDGLPASVIREAALLKRVGKVDSDHLIK